VVRSISLEVDLPGQRSAALDFGDVRNTAKAAIQLFAIHGEQQ
jgi:hypothetical protein